MKRRITNYLLKHLLGAVTVDDIITVDKGNIYIGGKIVTPSQLNQLQAEVKAMEGFTVWRLMTETLKEDAYKRGFTLATSFEHLNTAKLMLYNLSVQESIMRVIKNKQL